MIRLIGTVVACVGATVAIQALRAEDPGRQTSDEKGQLPLLFSDDFETSSAARWEPSDTKAWRVESRDGNTYYSQFQSSDVKTPVRSPFNRSLIKSLVVGDLQFDVRLQSTTRDYPHRDLCLFFGYQDPAHLYYVHLGKRTDGHANNIFIVNGAPRKKISTKTTAGTNWNDGWHHARIVRNVKSGSIAVYFDDLTHPAMIATDRTFVWGQVGIGSFDDTGNFDDVRLCGNKLQRGENNIPPKGFVALFNGRDLTGWKGLVGNPKTRAKMDPRTLAKAQAQADELMRGHWRIENGTILFDGKGKALCTARDYKDFELLVDWKISPRGDSGIYLRGSPQVQIWDPANRKIGSGGLFNNKKNPANPLAMADRPVGQWNRFRIKMVGDKVTVFLNDTLVVDNVTMENYWERDKPIYATGQIELQNHNSPLSFRNIFLREIVGK